MASNAHRDFVQTRDSDDLTIYSQFSQNSLPIPYGKKLLKKKQEKEDSGLKLADELLGIYEKTDDSNESFER